MDSKRWQPLEGASNFRDLGGYEAADGRTVKWGMVFRSGMLARLTDGDLDHVSRLDIKFVTDLRTAEEQDRQPSRLPSENPPQVASLSIRPDAKTPAEKLLLTGRFWEAAEAGDLTPQDALRAMSAFYRSYARDHTRQYGDFLRHLGEAGNRPILVHCAAGKDRTGFAAALLLHLLGVSMEQILDDYLLSNRAVEAWLESHHGGTFPAPLRAAVQAHPDFLTASFEAIEEAHGSFEDYLSGALGVDAGLRERLCTSLLE